MGCSASVDQKKPVAEQSSNNASKESSVKDMNNSQSKEDGEELKVTHISPHTHNAIIIAVFLSIFADSLGHFFLCYLIFVKLLQYAIRMLFST